jgi:hypothetical protein
MAYQKLQQGRAAEVTPDDINKIPYIGYPSETWPCVLYIGVTGDVRVLTAGGDDVIFYNVQGGTVLPIQVIQVFTTNTTALRIVALW